MLRDRRYMRGGDEEERAHSGLKCLFALILLNVLAVLLVPFGSMLQWQLSISGEGIREGMLWQPLSALFMHGGWMHLIFNMFGLYVFGTLLAPLLGASRFLSLYLFAGLFGNLTHLILYWNQPVVALGASGALMGVVIASAMAFPDREFMLIIPPVPMKLKTMAVVFIAIDILCELTQPASRGSVAYVVHIGGFVGGYLYMRVFLSKFVEWEPLGFLTGRSSKAFARGPSAPPRGWSIVTPPPPPGSDPSGRVTQKELDRILDKISATGINSLSEEELETLRRAREQMKGQ